jgi:signal transduction histidine kinase
MCLALSLIGAVTYAADLLLRDPLPIRPVASLAVAAATGVLAVMAGQLPRVRCLLALVACGFAALGAARLLAVRAADNAALGLLLAAAVYAVPAWPEIRALVGRGRARALIARQEHYAALIAGELHDEVLQLLALTRRQLDAAGTVADPGALRAAARDAVHRLDEQASVLRSIIAMLHPVALRGLGLTESVRSLAGRVAAENGLLIEVRVQGRHDPAGPAADDGATLAAYRIVQEALTNVVKHAGAQHVDVRLTYRCDHVSLAVIDDGRGLRQHPRPVPQGYGMQAMRWRCEAYGGSFSAASAEAGGTVVRATLPLSRRRCCADTSDA